MNGGMEITTTTSGTNSGDEALYPVMPNIQMTTIPRPDQPGGPPLLRETLGTVLRGLRGESGRTLRDVADTARVSPGYLSEIERGRKEASSELLASISDPSELKEFYLKPMSRSDCIDKCMIHIYEKHCGCLPIHISIWQRSSMFLNMSVCDYDDYERISPCLEKELSSTCYDTCKSDCIDR